MQTDTIQELDFKRQIKKTLAKVEKQSYRKLSFLMIGSAALLFGGHIVSDRIINEMKKADLILQQQKQLFVQDIKQMDEDEFNNMLEYISKNVSIYDEKVTFVQEVIVKAEEEEFNTVSTFNAESLGKNLTIYKIKIQEDIAKLTKLRRSVIHNIDVKREELDLFFHYMGAYRAKLRLNDENIDNQVHKLIYDADSGNHRYNKKHNVYEQIKAFDNEIKSFNFIEKPSSIKPKI